MEQTERDWYFLLPDGINKADTMKEGCEKLTLQTGHKYTSPTFKNLLKKGIIKRINRSTNSIITQCDADSNKTEAPL